MEDEDREYERHWLSNEQAEGLREALGITADAPTPQFPELLGMVRTLTAERDAARAAHEKTMREQIQWVKDLTDRGLVRREG